MGTKIIFHSLIFFIILLSLSGYSQSLISFGYVNTDKLLEQLPEKIKAVQVLQDYQKEHESEFEKMQQELQSKINYYNDNKETLSDSVIQFKEKELQDLQQYVQNLQNNAQQDIENKKAELMQPLIDKAKIAIKSVGEFNDIDFIFDYSSGMAIYSSDDVNDISDEVVRYIINQDNISLEKPKKVYSCAVINSDKLLSQLPDKENADQIYKSYYDELNNKLNMMKDERKQKYENIMANEIGMNDLEKQTKKDELQDLLQRNDKFEAQVQQDLQNKQEELLKPIIEKSKDAVKNVGKYNNIDIVFDSSMENILYYSDDIPDILYVVYQYYNNNKKISLIKSKKNYSYAVVDLDKLITQLPDNEKIAKNLQDYNEKFQREINKKLDDIKVKSEYYAANKEMMNDSIKQSKEKEYQNLHESYETYKAQAEKEVQENEEKIMRPIYDNIKTAIKETSIELNYDLTFDSSIGILLYYKPKYNITDDVLKRLKSKSELK